MNKMVLLLQNILKIKIFNYFHFYYELILSRMMTEFVSKQTKSGIMTIAKE